jgi:glutamate racemase
LADGLGREVVLVSSADETAFAVRAVFDGHPSAAELPAVDRRGAGRPARHRFLSSGDVAWFRELGGRLLGPELADAEAVTWAPSPSGSPAA